MSEPPASGAARPGAEHQEGRGASEPPASGAARRSRAAPTPVRVVLLVAGNVLRRKLRDRTAILLGIVTPLVMAGVIGLAFGGGITFEATIAVVDADGSAVTTALVDGLVAGMPADAPVRLVRRGDVEGGRRDLDAGTVDAVIVVPAGFGASLVATATGGPAASLRVVTDADKRIAGDVARSIAEGVSARLGASALAITTAIDAAGPGLEPAAIDALVAAGRQVAVPIALQPADVGYSYAPVAYFGASMGILFLFFTVGTGARSLITERNEGTLPRMRVAPVTDGVVLLGVSAGVMAIGFASLVTIWAVTSLVFRSSWGDPVAVLAVIAAVVFAVAGIGTLIAGLARTDAQADGMTSIVAFVFALLGGSFLQPGSLPPLLDSLSLATPNGWALRALTGIGAGGDGPGDVVAHLAVILGVGLVAGLIGVRALRAKVLA